MKKLLYKLASKYIALSKFFRNYRSTYSKMLSYYGKIHRENPEGSLVIINLATIFPLIGLLFESTLAMALNRRGHRVMVLLDDGFTCHNEIKAKPYLHSYAEISLMNRMIRKLAIRIPFIHCYSDLFNSEEKEEMVRTSRRLVAEGKFLLDGIDLRQHIQSSLVKYYASVDRIVSIETSEIKVIQMYACNAVISLRLAQKCQEEYKPVAYVNSHGIYSTWGPYYHFLKGEGIRPIIYDFGFFKKNGFLFSREGLTAEGNDDGFFASRGDKIDYSEALSYVDDLMQARGSGKGADIESMGGEKRFQDQLPQEFIERAKGRKVYGMFPNVLWDASITEQRSVFGDALKWISMVISQVRDDDSKLLVIRVHPHERPGKTTLFGVADIVKKILNETGGDSDSVILIPANSPLKSYSLFPYLDAGLVFNGTIGLEMAYHKIPVLTAGIAPYSNTQFIAAFPDPESYLAALETPNTILKLQETHRETMIKFIFMYFNMREIPLRFNHSDYYPKLPDHKVLDAILEDPNLEYICRAIVNKNLYFTEWQNNYVG